MKLLWKIELINHTTFWQQVLKNANDYIATLNKTAEIKPLSMARNLHSNLVVMLKYTR